MTAGQSPGTADTLPPDGSFAATWLRGGSPVPVPAT